MKNKIYRALAFNKEVSLCVLDVRDLVLKAEKIHGIKGKDSVMLGGMLACCAYMSDGLKDMRGSVSLTLKSADGKSTVCVSGDKSLCIRGYIDGDANGFKGGTLSVIRDDGYSRPFVGTCPVKTDDISDILNEYYAYSEQIPTAASIGVKLGGDGSCIAAGGVVMQLLPEASDEAAEKAAARMEEYTDAAEKLVSLGADGIWQSFKGDIFDEGVTLTHPDYVCDCSRGKIAGLLAALGRDECLDIIRERGSVDVHCHYCNTDYTFYIKDIDEIFKDR